MTVRCAAWQVMWNKFSFCMGPMGMLLYQLEEATQTVCMGFWIAFGAEDWRAAATQFSFIDFMHDQMEIALYPCAPADMMFGRCFTAFHTAVASQMHAWEVILKRHIPFWPEPLPEVLIGYITEVIDGDTFWISCGDLTKVDPSDIYSRFDVHKAGPTYKVRMAGIDAPEKNTPEGIEAKAYLTELIEEAFVRLQIDQSNPLGKFYRLIATVWRYDKNINEEMVRAGHAVPFTWKE